MYRTILALTGFLILALSLAPATGAATLDGHEIVFTGCPPYVAGYHCDSMFYQVVAVDVATGHPCSRVRYLLVSGPGTINPRTGLWIYHPELVDSIPHIRPYVEIAAYIGHDTTTSDDNCSFQVIVRDHGPRIRASGSLDVNLMPGDVVSRTFTMTDDDLCDTPRFVEMQASPTPAGVLTYDPDTNVLSFAPTVADSGRTFDVSLFFESGPSRPVVPVRFKVLELPPVDPLYAVRIETRDVPVQGSYAYLPVLLESIDVEQGMAGFDFLIGYDASALSFQSAEEGEIYDQCGWEYFTYYFNPVKDCGESCPSGMLEIVGMAETNNGPYHPGCNDGHPGYVDPENLPVTLGTIRFLVSNDQALAGQFSPVSFFWADCSDNSISNYSGGELFLSAAVYNVPDTLLDCVGEFPTFCGSRETLADEGCYYEIDNKSALAGVEFYNGGFIIGPFDTIDTRGDINCNGLAYEIADAIAFSVYFSSGAWLFGIEQNCSTEAADANGDGVPWTVADYGYIAGVVTGYLLPGTQALPDPDTARLVVDSRGNLTVDRDVAVLGIVLDGEVTVTGPGGNVKVTQRVITHDDLTRTIVLIEPQDWSGQLGAGVILTLPQTAVILQASASTYYGNAVAVTVDFTAGLNQYAVRIETKDSVRLGTLVDLAVTLESVNLVEGIGGFDFVIGYNPSYMSFILADEGDVYSLCGWEYFTYRFGPDGGFPSGGLAVIGIAESPNGPYHPGCNDGHVGYVDPESLPVTLCSLRFLTSANANLNGMFMPVSFYWMGCADNVISNFDGSKVYLSEEVYDPDDTLLQSVESFPTYWGNHATLAGEGCYFEDHENNKYALAGIRFYNGGVSTPEAPLIDSRGDINCNNIAYELADLLAFANEYVAGAELFGTAPECATHNSDVNKDGARWTAADYQYLKLVVAGESGPVWPSKDTTRVILDSRGSLSIDREIAELGLVLDGDVDVSGLAESLKMTRGVVTNDTITVTIVLIENEVWSGGIDPGVILHLPVGTTILQAEASTHDGAVVFVQAETMTGLHQYAVEIQKDSMTIPGQMVDLDINLYGVDPAQGLSGFNLLLGYHEEAMAFQSVTEGELFDLCDWEYFSFVRSYPVDCHESCPGGLLRMVGLADIAGGTTPDTTCFYGEGPNDLPMTIATIRFLASRDRTLECQYVPVRFYWTECGDNALSNRDGTIVYLSSHVYEYAMYRDPFHLGEIQCTDEFPTFCGTFTTLEAAGCFGTAPWAPNAGTAGVLFQNGGADFVCSGWLEPWGDINLNGAPYEVADAVLFTQYFIQGTSVFVPHVEGSIAASDVNRNGIPLEISDLILLIRVIIGDIDPENIPLGPIVPGVLHRNAVDDNISITCDDKTTALQVVVDGEITPVLLDPEMTLSFGTDNGATRILILTDSLHPMHETPFLALPGAGGITKVDAANTLGQTVQLTIDGITDVPDGGDALPNEFALGTNYPNPFNPTTTISYTLPEVATVEIVVYNVMGQTVRTLFVGAQSAGEYDVEWDGRDVGGAPVASGIYFYRMTAGDFTQSKKMMLLK